MERKEGAVWLAAESCSVRLTPQVVQIWLTSLCLGWVGGVVELYILSLSVRMRSFHLPHIKLRGWSLVTDDFPLMNPSLSGQFKRGIDWLKDIAPPSPHSLTISPHCLRERQAMFVFVWPILSSVLPSRILSTEPFTFLLPSGSLAWYTLELWHFVLQCSFLSRRHLRCMLLAAQRVPH